MSKIVGMSRESIVNEASQLLGDSDSYLDMAEGENPYGDGRAAERIVEVLSRWFQGKTPLLEPEKEFKVPPWRGPRRRKTDFPETEVVADAAKAASATNTK
jgi:hypothetical protein